MNEHELLRLAKATQHGATSRVKGDVRDRFRKLLSEHEEGDKERAAIQAKLNESLKLYSL